VNRESRWEVPSEYGYAAAIQSMGTIAAPLLAGISFALAVQVQDAPGSFYATGALLLLVAGAFGFVASVQFAFRARQFSVTPTEIEMWHPNPSEPARREMLRTEQRYCMANHRAWAKWAGWAYDFGIVAFSLGVTAALVPPAGLGGASNGRVAVVVLALAGVVAEIGWLIRTRSAGIALAPWPAPPGPESEA
jgi:hypothetical protein